VTGARKAGIPATFTLEFDCDRACQVEVDLEDVHVRFTLGQMIERAKLAHADAHAREWPTRVFAWRDDVIVRATLLAEAVAS
jgi:hypothetical protein